MGGSGIRWGGSEKSRDAFAPVVNVSRSRGVGLDRKSTIARHVVRVCACVCVDWGVNSP